MSEISVDFKTTIENSFLDYAAHVAQERSIPDVRDCLKLGLRQGLYAQYCEGITSKKPFKKAQKSVAAACSQSYVHGDSSMYGSLIRAAKPFAFRYPLEEVQGSYGTPADPDNHSASRYVEMRTSKISEYLFDGLKRNAIKEWYDNYDDTEKIPSVFPSIGYWNIVNGTSGIAVGMATSVPSFNLHEVNNALIKLIQNPDIDVKEILCMPDFCTGGILINAEEVRESLIAGQGKSCRLRAKINYNKDKHMLEVVELPYSVYTNTICKQIEQLVDENPEYGIDRLIDATKEQPVIRIYLTKGESATRMINKLYENTSLENHFGINMVMLDMGRYPKTFGWKDACQAYINHMSECKKNEINFNIEKLKKRNHIIEGLLIALTNIDEVVKIIKSASSTSLAKTFLMETFKIDGEQAEAILELKLQRLVNLEAIKLETERKENTEEISNLTNILANKDKFNAILIELLQKVANEFGDERRTIIQDVEKVKIDIKKEIKKIWLTRDSKGIMKQVEKEPRTEPKWYVDEGTKFFDLDTNGIGYYFTTEDLPRKTINPINELHGKYLMCLASNGKINRIEIVDCFAPSRKSEITIMKLEPKDKLIGTVVGDEQQLVQINTSLNRTTIYPFSEVRLTKPGSQGVQFAKSKKDELPKEIHLVSNVQSNLRTDAPREI